MFFLSRRDMLIDSICISVITVIQYLCIDWIVDISLINTLIPIVSFNLLCFFSSYNILRYILIPLYSCINLFILVISVYFYVSQKRIEKSDILALFTTNRTESFEFVLNFVVHNYIYLILSVLFCIFLCVYFFKNSKINNKIIIVSIICVFLFRYSPVYGIVRDYRAVNREYCRYDQLYKIKESRVLSVEKEKILTDTRKQAFFIIIGESSNRNYMSCYGYKERNTTPFMNNDWYVMKKAFSCDTMTSICVPYSLSMANYYNKKNIEDSFDIINVLNLVGFDTYWISNQSKYGDTFIKLLGDESKNRLYYDKSDAMMKDFEKLDYSTINDFVLIEGVYSNVLKSNKEKNNIFFVHLYGSHYPYVNRYPSSFMKAETIEDQYMASILFTDYVIEEIRKIAENNFDIFSICYYSDHGEYIGHPRSRDIKNFQKDMVEIPMAFYFSEGYKKMYPEDVYILGKNTSKIITNDIIFEQILSIAHVTIGKKILSIFDKDFYIKEPVVYGGKVSVFDEEKIVYRNIEK